MTKIYLVRHGETLFNVERRVQGWCDSPLTQKGILQAKALHEKLKNIPFEHAYASSSGRAIDTANYIIEGRNIPLTLAENLREQNYGSLEGTKDKLFQYSEKNKGRIDVLQIMNKINTGFVEYGGENYESVINRFMEMMEEIVRKNPCGNVLVVSHGGVILSIVYYLMNGSGLEDLRPPENCSVTILNYDEKFSVTQYNGKSC